MYITSQQPTGIILILQAIELLVWPCIITNKVMDYIQKQLHPEQRRASMRERCLGTCLACVGVLTCYRGGGKNVAKQGSFTDVTKAMMDFMHTGGTLDIVFSDLYVAFKMLVRVQRERLYSLLLEYDAEAGGGDAAIVPSRGRSIAAGNYDGVGKVAGVWENRMRLSPLVESEMPLIKDASRFVLYSDAIYGSFHQFLSEHNLLSSANEEEFLGPKLGITLDDIGFPGTTIEYAQFHQSGIDETPYAILANTETREVILTVRGSASLEDLAVDLQLIPMAFSDIGKICGFDGVDQYCHKGVLTRAYWIYRNVEQTKMLDSLLQGEQAKFPDYQLVITGHRYGISSISIKCFYSTPLAHVCLLYCISLYSLGAGCAALLAIMLRGKFPKLRCFAFCPPGGLITERLASECRDYVTSFVNGADIVPRMSYENMERLRDDVLEVIARIRIPKQRLMQILSKPCSDQDLAYLNSLLLHDMGNIPDTKYSRQLREFRLAQQRRKETSDLQYVPLFIPGSIVFISRSKRGHIVQWANRFDFSEIFLTPTFVTDHSTSTVITNIDDVITTFENSANGVISDVEEIAEAAVLAVLPDPTPREEHDTTILEAPTFVCCSRPHGNLAVFLPGVLVICSLLLSFLANNHCGFVSRTTQITDTYTSATRSGIGVATGLWWFREKVYGGSGPKDDPASYVDGDACVTFPANFTPDVYLNVARGCATSAGKRFILVIFSISKL